MLPIFPKASVAACFRPKSIGISQTRTVAMQNQKITDVCLLASYMEEFMVGINNRGKVDWVVWMWPLSICGSSNQAELRSVLVSVALWRVRTVGFSQRDYLFTYHHHDLALRRLLAPETLFSESAVVVLRYCCHLGLVRLRTSTLSGVRRVS
jgi:hypothetical protein